MTASFKFDEQAIQAVAQQAAAVVAQRLQRLLDGLHAEYAGEPVEVIKPVLARRWAEANGGAQITDPELGDYAQRISDGQRIEFRLG